MCWRCFLFDCVNKEDMKMQLQINAGNQSSNFDLIQHKNNFLGFALNNHSCFESKGIGKFRSCFSPGTFAASGKSHLTGNGNCNIGFSKQKLFVHLFRSTLVKHFEREEYFYNTIPWDCISTGKESYKRRPSFNENFSWLFNAYK